MDDLMEMWEALKSENRSRYMPKIGFAVVSAVFSVLLLVGGGFGGMMLADIKNNNSEFHAFKEEATTTHAIRGIDIKDNEEDITELKRDMKEIDYKLEQIMIYVQEKSK